MDDAAFIIGLMKTETDALGFIPSPDIRTRWVAKGRCILQTDRRGRRRGYILHGPARPGRPLYVNQVCMEYDHRLKGYATLAVRELIRRAVTAGSPEIRLRCAADLSANDFWTAIGFLPNGITQGGKRRNRQIISYSMILTKSDSPLLIPERFAILQVLGT